MLSLYSLLRPPQFGNCQLWEEETENGKLEIDQFKILFPKSEYGSARKKNIAEFKEKFSDYIKIDPWEFPDDDGQLSYWNISTFDTYLVYNLCGALCCKMLTKKMSCLTCQQAFSNSMENLLHGIKEADVVNKKNRGGLIHPNFHLYTLCNRLEDSFAYFITHNKMHNIMDNVCKRTFECEGALTFPCEEHAADMIIPFVYDYVKMRMYQWSQHHNGSKKKASREKRKSAKHEET